MSDEALHLAALRSIFQGMQVSVDAGKRINNSWPERPRSGELSYPDSMADDAVYRVVGKPLNKIEGCASGDVLTDRTSNTRQVRMELFNWPKEGSAGLLAVLQYDFLEANPPMSCPTIGLLVHLVRSAANWEGRDGFLLDPVHHSSLQRIELSDVTGDGVEELTVESSYGGAGLGASSLQVFELSHGKFEQVLNTDSRLDDSPRERFLQALDVSATVQNRGGQFCASKTILLERGKRLNPPRVTHHCYKRGFGVTKAGSSSSGDLLAPRR